MNGAERSAVTVGVVSAFNPSNNLVRNCEALLMQCADVIVVDDGSSSPDESIFEAVSASGCSVLRLDTNSGIAAALNEGVRLARSSHPDLDFILTMDQDSRIEPGFVRNLEMTAADASSDGLKVGMVAPGRVSGLPSRARRKYKSVVIGDEPVQSGLLIPVICVDAIGPFNEELFIDGVDSEFYLRAKAAGWNCIIAQDASLMHSLGTLVPANLGPLPIQWRGQPLMVRTAASWRYYFIARNRILLCRRFFRTDPYWAVRGLLLDVRHLLLVSTLANGRWARLSAALRGCFDGIRGRTGPSPLRQPR